VLPERGGSAVTNRGLMRDGVQPGRSAPAPGQASRVLVVGDHQEILDSLRRLLIGFGHEVEVARDGAEALARLKLGIDLVLVDAAMPGMDGFSRRIRSDAEFHDLPVLLVTGQDSRTDRLRAVEAGVDDFIAQPVDPAELRLRSASLLRMKAATDGLKRQRAELELTVAQRTRDLRRALDETVQAQRTTTAAQLDTVRRLAVAAEFKDRDAAAHIERVGRYCELLGQSLNLAPQAVERLRCASAMHDVGKIGIPGSLLVLSGELHPGEAEVMQQHTVFGAYLLHGSPSELLQMGETIAISHHERWDGAGYPAGIAGDAIPLAGRICAVADVFDALTSDRPYRAALPNHTAYDMMAAERGRHFDPAVLDAFLAQRAALEAVQQRHRYSAA
jgi:putative two-component system response regulator